MKKINLIFIALFTLISLFSCKKDDDKTEVLTAVSNDEAAEIVANSMGTNSGGAGFVMGSTSSLGSGYNKAEKSALADTSFIVSYTYGDASFDFEVSYTWEILMNPSMKRPELDITFSTVGKAISPKISSDGTSTGKYVFYGLLETDPNYVMNGTFKRTGTTTLKISQEKSITSELNITFTELKYNKTGFVLESGTATVNLIGLTSDGKTFDINGSIVYTNSSTATLTIGDKSYTINVTEGKLK